MTRATINNRPGMPLVMWSMPMNRIASIDPTVPARMAATSGRFSNNEKRMPQANSSTPHIPRRAHIPWLKFGSGSPRASANASVHATRYMAAVLPTA